MRPRRTLGVLTIVALVTLAFATAVQASTVLHLQLGELADRADLVFRGTVLSVEEGTVEAGGTVLPTVVYRLRVDEAFKGDLADEKGVAEITMVGGLKQQQEVSGSLVRFSRLPALPRLVIGGEYVLFTTPPSRLGLSTTVGLGQGAFKIFLSDDRQEMAANEIGNAGLSSEINGPVPYEELANAIREEVGP